MDAKGVDYASAALDFWREKASMLIQSEAAATDQLHEPSNDSALTQSEKYMRMFTLVRRPIRAGVYSAVSKTMGRQKPEHYDAIGSSVITYSYQLAATLLAATSFSIKNAPVLACVFSGVHGVEHALTTGYSSAPAYGFRHTGLSHVTVSSDSSQCLRAALSHGRIAVSGDKKRPWSVSHVQCLMEKSLQCVDWIDTQVRAKVESNSGPLPLPAPFAQMAISSCTYCIVTGALANTDDTQCTASVHAATHARMFLGELAPACYDGNVRAFRKLAAGAQADRKVSEQDIPKAELEAREKRKLDESYEIVRCAWESACYAMGSASIRESLLQGKSSMRQKLRATVSSLIHLAQLRAVNTCSTDASAAILLANPV
jgi:hypothetical protein